MTSRRIVRKERAPDNLQSWAGHWVAVKDGKVIAAAQTSNDLVRQVKSRGSEGSHAVAQFVPLPSDTIVIGVG